MLTGNHAKLDKKSLREMFDEMDKAGDGTVDFYEFRNALKVNPKLI